MVVIHVELLDGAASSQIVLHINVFRWHQSIETVFPGLLNSVLHGGGLDSIGIPRTPILHLSLGHLLPLQLGGVIGA